MTNDSNGGAASPMAEFARQMQRASEEATAQQLDWFENVMTGGPGTNGSIGDLGEMSTGAAVFKTRVQSGGRISIPDAERDALDIGEGDLVQAFVIPINHGESNE